MDLCMKLESCVGGIRGFRGKSADGKNVRIILLCLCVWFYRGVFGECGDLCATGGIDDRTNLYGVSAERCEKSSRGDFSVLGGD